jgi:hypothetical protein
VLVSTLGTASGTILKPLLPTTPTGGVTEVHNQPARRPLAPQASREGMRPRKMTASSRPLPISLRGKTRAVRRGRSNVADGWLPETLAVARDHPVVRPCWRRMDKAIAPTEPAAVPPDPDRLRRAAREAHNDAAPFALAAAGILVGFALVSRHAHWKLLGHQPWSLWLVIAVPYACLSATLLFGLGRLIRHDRRREIVIALLSLVWIFNVLGVVVLVISLVAHSGVPMTGRQLLSSAGAVWLTDAIALGSPSGNLTAAVRLLARLRPRHASPTSSSPKTRMPNSHGKAGLLAYGITSTCR